MHKQYSRKKNRNAGNIMRFVYFYTDVIPECRLSGKISRFSYTESSRKTGVIHYIQLGGGAERTGSV